MEKGSGSGFPRARRRYSLQSDALLKALEHGRVAVAPVLVARDLGQASLEGAGGVLVWKASSKVWAGGWGGEESIGTRKAAFTYCSGSTDPRRAIVS